MGGPSHYLVLRNGRQVGSVPAGVVSWTNHGLAPGATYHYTVVATVPGTTTSHTDQGQSPGTSKYTVVAQWGDYLSGPSAAASGATIAAPLSSEVPVRIDTTRSPGSSWGPIVVGYHWDDTWSAAPTCTPSGCPVITMTISVGPSGTFENASLPVTLHGSGAVLALLPESVKARATGLKPRVAHKTVSASSNSASPRSARQPYSRTGTPEAAPAPGTARPQR